MDDLSGQLSDHVVLSDEQTSGAPMVSLDAWLALQRL